MNRISRWIALLALGLTAALLFGCGGSGPTAPPVGAGTGNLAVRVQLAAPQKKASRSASRQVPVGAVVIKVTLTDPATMANLAQPQIVAAPAPGQTAIVQFSGIRTGPVHVAVAAYPDQNASQPPLALGQADITIMSGEATPVTVTLLPTADHINVTGAGSLSSGSSLTLTAQVFDASNTPLIGYPLVWTSGNTNIATVMVNPSNPYSATVTGVAPGTVTVEVREPNSGIKDLLTINVVAASGGLQAGSPWPMFHANLSHTGQGIGSGAVGTQKWVFTTGNGVRGNPTIGADGTIYVGSLDGNVYALNGTTGQQIWAFTTKGEVSSSAAIGANGAVYVGSFDGNVYALNAKTGQQIWSFNTVVAIEGSPAIGADGTVYVGSNNDNVYALNGATGQQIWVFKAGGAVNASPAIGKDGTVYIGSNDGNVYALDGATGQQIWSFTTGSAVISAPAIGADGTVYVGSFDSNVYALNGATGHQIWVFKTQGQIFSSPAIGSDGTVYIGSDDHNVYALNGATGQQIWVFTTGGLARSSPAIGANGTIYVGSNDGNLYALNGATGQQIGVFSTGVSFEASPSIGSDGTIYMGCDNFNVYAIG